MVYPLGNNGFNPDNPFVSSDKANFDENYNNSIFGNIPDISEELDFDEMAKCYVGGRSSGYNINDYRRQHNYLLNKHQTWVPKFVQNRLSKETIALNKKQYPASPAANVNLARKHLNITVEVSSQEYKNMNPNDRKFTQMAMIGGIQSTLSNGQIHTACPSDDWCALFISSINRDLGIEGWSHFCDVPQFVKKAKSENRWHKMSSWPKPTKKAIKAQLSGMKPGDYIVFNGDKPNGKRRGHIGIIEFVDVKNGTITTIEGNAKGSSKDKTEGVVRKIYKISDLIKEGYGGYINTKGIK